MGNLVGMATAPFDIVPLPGFRAELSLSYQAGLEKVPRAFPPIRRRFAPTLFRLWRNVPKRDGCGMIRGECQKSDRDPIATYLAGDNYPRAGDPVLLRQPRVNRLSLSFRRR